MIVRVAKRDCHFYKKGSQILNEITMKFWKKQEHEEGNLENICAKCQNRNLK